MPNRLSALPVALTKLTHDPTVTLKVDPMGFMGDDPYGTMTDEILFGALNMLLGWIKDVTGIDLTGFAKFLEGLLDQPSLTEWLSKLSVDAARLFGTPWPNLFEQVPLESIISQIVNYLANPLFDSPDCLVNGDRWIWDGTVYYPEDDTAGETKGSVYIDANGEDNDLCSNPVKATEGHIVSGSIMVRWAGLAATGTPISLMIEGLYVADDVAGVMDSVELKAIAAPGTEGEWEELSGDYEVPSGCNAVRLVPHVGASATAGRVHFSYGSLTKPLSKNIVPKDWVDGLEDALSGLDQFTQNIVAFVGQAIDGIFHPTMTLTEFWDMVAGWFDDTQVTAGNATDALGWLTDFFGAFSRVFGAAETPTFAAAEQAVVDLNGRIVALEGVGMVITHTVSGVWTNPTPADHNLITFVCVNGGDGGSRGNATIYDTAKGGQSGGYIQKSFYTDELPATITKTIGAAGAGATAAGQGSVGQVTSLGSYLVGLKGVGAVFKTEGAIPYETGVAPGNGGNGAFYIAADAILLPSADGEGGPFAPGGRAGFGNSSAESAGSNGAAAPVDIPSGGGGGGGGSIYTPGTSGVGGVGGFPGGGGGGGARDGGQYRNGGNAGAGVIYEIRHW